MVNVKREATLTLIPFAKQYLRINEALPFGLRDVDGRLLLAAGTCIENESTLSGLLGGDLFAYEAESSEWRRRLGAAMDAKMMQNASLQAITEARPDLVTAKKVVRENSLAEDWQETVGALDTLLRDIRPEPTWWVQLQALHERSVGLHDRKPDASLYWQIYTAGHSTVNYSSSHSMLCMLVAREAALRLSWPDGLINSLSLAAMAMNVSMRRLMDRLAAAEMRFSAEVRADILSHPERSAQVLVAASVTDKTLIQIVRLHHDDTLKAKPLAELDAAQGAARLLRRVDIFIAKLSKRFNRIPMSPVQAAREACLGVAGVPDEIGSALLKAIGMYPPGSCVELQSGEVGIVVGRGRQANMPIVAALIGTAGTPLGVPAIRDSADQRHFVKRAVSTRAMRVVPPHDSLMSVR